LCGLSGLARQRLMPAQRGRCPNDAHDRISGLLRILHPESDLECHLEVLDLAVVKVPADVGDLEPVKASHRTCRALYPDADRVVNSLRGRADDLR
jgi:hypothetical protein